MKNVTFLFLLALTVASCDTTVGPHIPGGTTTQPSFAFSEGTYIGWIRESRYNTVRRDSIVVSGHTSAIEIARLPHVNQFTEEGDEIPPLTGVVSQSGVVTLDSLTRAWRPDLSRCGNLVSEDLTVKFVSEKKLSFDLAFNTERCNPISVKSVDNKSQESAFVRAG